MQPRIADTPPRVEFRPATGTAHHNRISRRGDRTSRLSSAFSDDSDDELTSAAADTRKRSNFATYLGTSTGSRAPVTPSRDHFKDPSKDPYLQFEGSTTASYDFLQEEPQLRKYVHKVTLANAASARFYKARGRIIEKLKQTYVKACRILKVSELRHFVRQIGERQISMSNQCLSWQELNSIISVLVNDEYAHSLDISGNSLDINSAGYIAKLLDRNSHITDLNLANNSFDKSGLPMVIEVVCKSKHLIKLSLAGNQLTDNLAAPIAKLIKVSRKITDLDLSHNEFREKGGMLIGDALGTNDDLERLNMSWNHLRGKGAECIAMGVMKNASLISLNISWNGFGFEGAVAMAHALRYNTTLEELDISSNRIHPPALYELLKGLVGNKSLLKLRLGENPITAMATTPLMCCIRDNPQMALQEIDLSGVVVDKEFEVALDEIRDTRPNFRAIYDIVLPVHKEKWEALTRRTEGNVIFNIDPVKILYYTQRNLRVVDLFRQMDRDGSNRLSRDEIRDSLKRADFNLSSSAMDAIFSYLDTNNDGEIDLGEFLSGSRHFKRQTIAERQYQEERPKIEIEEAHDGVGADPGGAQSRFSSSFRPGLMRGGGVLSPPPDTESSKSRSDLKLSTPRRDITDVKQ